MNLNFNDEEVIFVGNGVEYVIQKNVALLIAKNSQEILDYYEDDKEE